MDQKQRWLILGTVYALFLAIGIAALLATLGYFPNASPAFKDWSVAVLFADVAAAAVTVFKTQFASKEARLYVNLTFDGAKPSDIDLSQVEFVVLDGEMVVKKKGQAAVVKGPGGWQIQFSWLAEPADTAHLILVEHSGRKWRVANFSPTTVEQRAMLVV